eukprot:3524328-Rhodomonas_salina.1
MLSLRFPYPMLLSLYSYAFLPYAPTPNLPYAPKLSLRCDPTLYLHYAPTLSLPYDPTLLCYVGVPRWGMVLRVCYEMCGTELGYGGTRDVRELGQRVTREG